MIEANFHRCGADLIGGEQSGRNGWSFGDDQRQVLFFALIGAFSCAQAFDVAKNCACQKALGCGDPTWNPLNEGTHVKKRRRLGALEKINSGSNNQ